MAIVGSSTCCNDSGSRGAVVTDMHTQRELFTAQERRAQVIAQLREQAVIRARVVAARRKAVTAEIAVGVQRRRVAAWLIVVGTAFWGLAAIVIGHMIANKL
jgi:hypothetical protein